MKAEELAQKSEAKITMTQLLRSPSLRLPLLIAVIMQLSQQLSGINAVQTIQNIANLFFSIPFAGLLLLNKFIYNYRTKRYTCQICYYWHRNCNGYNDFNFYSFNGQIRKKDFALVWTRRNVYFFYFYYYFIFSQGKKTRTLNSNFIHNKFRN